MTRFTNFELPRKKSTRNVKPDRLKDLKRACKINDTIFAEIVKNFKTFTTEKDIERYILKRFEDHGVESSYPPIVANNNAVIHAKPRNIKLKKGFLLLDFGARVNKQCSDMTRTIHIGKASQKKKHLYHMILLAQDACIHQAKVGTICGEIDALARHLLGKHERHFRHGLGHGVGTKIHVKPKLRPDSTDKLKDGDFITIEPGIYIRNAQEEFGIRIEDTLHVSKRTKVLTKSPKKELIEV